MKTLLWLSFSTALVFLDFWGKDICFDANHIVCNSLLSNKVTWNDPQYQSDSLSWVFSVAYFSKVSKACDNFSALEMNMRAVTGVYWISWQPWDGCRKILRTLVVIHKLLQSLENLQGRLVHPYWYKYWHKCTDFKTFYWSDYDSLCDNDLDLKAYWCYWSCPSLILNRLCLQKQKACFRGRSFKVELEQLEPTLKKTLCLKPRYCDIYASSASIN